MTLNRVYSWGLRARLCSNERSKPNKTAVGSHPSRSDHQPLWSSRYVPSLPVGGQYTTDAIRVTAVDSQRRYASQCGRDGSARRSAAGRGPGCCHAAGSRPDGARQQPDAHKPGRGEACGVWPQAAVRLPASPQDAGECGRVHKAPAHSPPKVAAHGPCGRPLAAHARPSLYAACRCAATRLTR